MSLVHLEAAHNMRPVAEDEVGTGIDDRVCKGGKLPRVRR